VHTIHSFTVGLYLYIAIGRAALGEDTCKYKHKHRYKYRYKYKSEISSLKHSLDLGKPLFSLDFNFDFDFSFLIYAFKVSFSPRS